MTTQRGKSIRSARWFWVVLLASLGGPVVPGGAAGAAEIIIGTGGETGVYYHVGRAICRFVNRDLGRSACEAVPTAGSLFNLANVQTGGIDIGMAQSDAQFHAVNGSGPFEFVDTKFDNVRALFSVHSEPFTVVARRSARIGTFDDLRGKRVNVGNPGSGHRATMEMVMGAKKWSMDDFQLAEELPPAEQSLALCYGRVQALVYAVGHPNPSVSRATGLCNAILVGLAPADIAALVAANPYFTPATIPGGVYAGNPDPVETFGVKATVVASADLDPDLAYAVVKAVFTNLKKFRQLHPAFGALDPAEMTRDGLSAPLHEGAQRYYTETGQMMN